jgi:hypothetical protein
MPKERKNTSSRLHRLRYWERSRTWPIPPDDEPVVLDESPEDFELLMGWLLRSAEFAITEGSSVRSFA